MISSRKMSGNLYPEFSRCKQTHISGRTMDAGRHQLRLVCMAGWQVRMVKNCDEVFLSLSHSFFFVFFFFTIRTCLFFYVVNWLRSGFTLFFFFFIRTSNFDAEAERSYIFWRFEAETFLRWLNTVFDTSVSVTFSSKTLDPLVAKIGTKQVNNINFNFLIIELTYVPLPWQHD